MTSEIELPTALNVEVLNSLLRTHLDPMVSVLSYTIRPLTQPGENYGSTLIVVDAKLKHQREKGFKTWSFVAKFFPTVPILCTLINITRTFGKELDFYKLVLPEFKRIQVENGVPEEQALNIFPLYYGSRLSLNEDAEIADTDAVLLLENLKVSRYVVADRKTGLDYEHTSLVMAELARFHALSIALKLKKPHVFNETVKKAGLSCKWGPAQDYQSLNKWKNAAIDALKLIPECHNYVGKVKDFLFNETKIEEISKMPPREPFATFIHNDFWIMNIMFRYAGDIMDSDIIGLKFLDFQLSLYHSPIKDIIVFFYTSVAEGVLDQHFDHLIDLYHSRFISCLQQLKCDTGMFSMEQLVEEFDTFAITEFSRLLMALKVFCLEQENAQDPSNFDLDKVLEEDIEGNKLYMRRMKEFVLIYIHKGWL